MIAVPTCPLKAAEILEKPLTGRPTPPAPGDVVLVRGSGLIPWLIRLFSWGWWRGEARTRWNHVGIVEGPLGCGVSVIESTWPKVRRRMLAGVEADAEEIAVWRYSKLGEIQQGKLVMKARQYLGRRYPWWAVAAHAADGLLGGAYLFRRLIPDQGRYGICSWLVAYAYDECAGVRFLGMPPDRCQPDDIGDCVEASPDWVRVG